MALFSVFIRQKVIINGNIIFTDYASEIRVLVCSRPAINWKTDNDVTPIFQHDVIVNFFGRCFLSLVKLSYWSKLEVNIITGSGVKTIFFYRDWPEIRKLELPLSESFPISGDWGELGIPNLARISLIKCYSMLLNTMVTTFSLSELFRKIQQRGRAS